MNVVDLTTGIAGAYCTKILRDFGYPVTKTHAPDGLLHEYLARGKTVDPNADLSQATVLVADSLSLANQLPPEPGQVVVSITPFGLDGPWADKPATEFTLQAWSGAMVGLGRGFPDRAPVCVGGQVGDWVSGLYAAIGAQIALARGPGEDGEIVDVSMLEAIALCLTYYPVSYYGMARRPFRKGRAPVVPGIETTKDGLVGLGVGTGQQWLDFCVLVGHPEWQEDRALFMNRGHLAPEIAEWMSERTMAEVLDLADAFRIPHAPVANGSTVATNEHFVARGSIADGAPTPPVRFTPPLPNWPAVLPESGATAGQFGFEGLRVVDLTAFWAGPLVTHVLGMLGAEVIHIESTKRPDGTRMLGGKKFSDENWWECSGIFSGLNTNKKSVTLDLGDERGRDLLRQLIATADVLVENYTPRVMDQLGIDLDAIRAERPELIVLRMPGFGLDGPWRDKPAFAFVIEDASGLSWMTGYPDRNPLSPYSLGDPNAGLHALSGLLHALAARATTGDGVAIEASMVDAALNIAAEQVLEFDTNGVLLERDGNRNAKALFQDLFAADGEDSWVAIACETDEQVAALRKITGDDVAAWCAARAADEVVETLWADGVPVAKLCQPHQQSEIPQLIARGYFEEVEHPIAGTAMHSTVPFRFGHGPSRWHHRHAPLLGEHNDEVLSELGLSPDEIAALAADGVIGKAPVR